MAGYTLWEILQPPGPPDQQREGVGCIVLLLLALWGVLASGYFASML